MADFYIDGTISSASGTGSGTLLDPWGKDDDLLAFALTQAGGSGTHGNQFIVVDGDLNSTAELNLSGYSFEKPFIVKPLVMDGSQRIAYDAGGFDFHTSSSISGIGVYFMDFTNMPTSGKFFDINGRGKLVGCSFDGTGKTGGTWVNPGIYTVVLGNRFFNDSRTSTGLFLLAGQGCLIQGNVFEDISNSEYDIYSYSSGFTNNVLTYASTYTYTTGSLLPIDGGKVCNNTFIGPGAFNGGTPAASAILISNNYEQNHFANNYFEGFVKVFNLADASTHPYLINQLLGNKYYDCTRFLENLTPDESLVMNQQNEELSSSGLVDVAGGDYRPNNLLINQGYDPFAMVNAITNTLRPTVGALENSIVVPRVRDLY